MKRTNDFETTLETSLPGLYRLGAIAALLLLAYCLATLVLMGLTGGQPATVEETFRMLQDNRLLGLLRLDLLTVFAMPLYYGLFLALLAALWRARPLMVGLATLMVFIGVTIFLSTPSLFSYLTLSDKYAAASTEAQRAQFLAAGEALLAMDIWHSTTTTVGGILLQTGALLISIAMLPAKSFGRAAAYTGILTHGLDLLHIIVAIFAPQAGIMLMIIAGPLYLVWFPLVAVGLARLAKHSAASIVEGQPARAAANG